MELDIIIFGSIEQGLIFGIMAIGVYLTFRILNYPDLTVDGSFALGGAVAASLITGGGNPWISTLLSLLAGGAAGAITGILHTKGRINGLLAGILTMIALYSINLRVMGKANVPLLNADTITSQLTENPVAQSLGSVQKGILTLAFLLIVLLIKWGMDWFLHTDLGMAVRATGDNPAMIRSLGVNTDHTIMIGLILSNALVGLAGGMMAQYQGYADAQMGVGMIIIGLASVIIGEVVFGSRSIYRATIAVVGGAILYRFVIAAALWLGLKPTDMKLVTAILVVLALTLPRYLGVLQKNGRALTKGGNG
nr:ABC transporter permease [Thermicanus aegyptius]